MKQRNKHTVKALVEKKVSRLLKEWLPFRAMPVQVIFSDRKTFKASVSWGVRKDSFGYRQPDYSCVQLILAEYWFLNPKTTLKQLERTICHEVAHIIQKNCLTIDEFKELRNTPVEKNSISTYTPNVLEFQAEVFAINLCGSSNHSLEGAKKDPMYRPTLRQFIDLTQPIEIEL